VAAQSTPCTVLQRTSHDTAPAHQARPWILRQRRSRPWTSGGGETIRCTAANACAAAGRSAAKANLIDPSKSLRSFGCARSPARVYSTAHAQCTSREWSTACTRSTARAWSTGHARGSARARGTAHGLSTACARSTARARSTVCVRSTACAWSTGHAHTVARSLHAHMPSLPHPMLRRRPPSHAQPAASSPYTGSGRLSQWHLPRAQAATPTPCTGRPPPHAQAAASTRAQAAACYPRTGNGLLSVHRPLTAPATVCARARAAARTRNAACTWGVPLPVLGPLPGHGPPV
jgi:hypothetical protein